MEIAIIGFFVLLIVLAVGVFIFVQNKENETQAASTESLSRRIEILQDGFADQGGLEARNLNQNFVDQLNDDFVNLIGSFAPVPSKDRMDMLNKAGLRTPNAYIWVFIQQVTFTVVFAAIGFASIVVVGAMPAILISLLMGLMGFMGPISDMRKRIKERSYKIDKTLPDMIDLFANCCIAGVSFDIAAGYILSDLGNDELMNPIKEDFLAWQADVNLGMERPESWKRLSDRSESKNIRYFTSLINQSEKTGGSVAEALFKMSGFFRERRKQQIESEIAQIPTKMSTQTIAFIFLPIILLLLGPILLNAYKMATDLFR
jgi:tight adherence protein C